MQQPIDRDQPRRKGTLHLLRPPTATAVVMIFSGEYDFAIRDQLRIDLGRLANVPSVVLDLSEVTFADASTIAELIHLHKIRASNGLERESIVITNPHLMRIFRIAELTKIFDFADSLKQALRRLGKVVALDYAQSAAAQASVPLRR